MKLANKKWLYPNTDRLSSLLVHLVTNV